MSDQLPIFEPPADDRRPATSLKRPGRNRETYARTVVADVTVVDEAALQDAGLHALDERPSISLGHVAEGFANTDPRDQIANCAQAALDWLCEPTAGLWPTLEAGMVRLVATDMEMAQASATAVRLSWTVRIKLHDISAFRALALAACPHDDQTDRREIEQSFAAAWQWAVEPYRPLQGIPGIVWSPVNVAVTRSLPLPASPTVSPRWPAWRGGD